MTFWINLIIRLTWCLIIVWGTIVIERLMRSFWDHWYYMPTMYKVGSQGGHYD